jgi:hypothetical protein
MVGEREGGEGREGEVREGMGEKGRREDVCSVRCMRWSVRYTQYRTVPCK